MSKPHRKALLRLQSRVAHFNASPYSEEGPSKRKNSGGYRMPGSMNPKKTAGRKKLRAPRG